MKKRFAVLAAATMLCTGIWATDAYAAEGWAMSDNSWVYLNASGSRVKNEWRRGADNLWRYLNNNGEMAINTWAEEDYYVDANGIMVSNAWIKTSPYFDSKDPAQWFYFGSSGKKVSDGWKKINGQSYLFDEEGIMKTGWSDDGMYYLGDDGAMKTGWRYLTPPEDEDVVEYGPESSDGKYWYYFSGNGKKYCPEANARERYKVSKINGEYYCFDENGRMQTGWVYLLGHPADAPRNSIEDWRYFAEPAIQGATVGTAIQGWLSLEAPSALQASVEDDVVWYYFESNGKPKIGPAYGEASTDDFVRVNGNTYLFNPIGNPVSGLHQVEIGSTGEYTSYYFDENTKTPVKGKKKIKEGDGTEYTYYFKEGSYAGRGVTGVQDGYLYYMGKIQKADIDYAYSLISIPAGNGYDTYMVNKSGKVMKNRTIKDEDDTKYTLDKSGILTHIDGKAAGKSLYGHPVEPEFDLWY